MTFSDRVGIANLSIAILAIVITLYVFVQQIGNQHASARALMDAQGTLQITADRLKAEQAMLAALQRRAFDQVRAFDAQNAELKRTVGEARDQLDILQAQNVALSAALRRARAARNVATAK